MLLECSNCGYKVTDTEYLSLKYAMPCLRCGLLNVFGPYCTGTVFVQEYLNEFESSIKEQLFALYEEQELMEKRHKSECEEMRARIRQLQNICPHENTKYVPDPSGNNDSYYVCLDCHKEKKYF